MSAQAARHVVQAVNTFVALTQIQQVAYTRITVLAIDSIVIGVDSGPRP